MLVLGREGRCRKTVNGGSAERVSSPHVNVVSGVAMKETYVLGGLQVDDGQLPSLALCDEGQISAGFDLHGCPKRQREVCSPVEGKVRSSVF